MKEKKKEKERKEKKIILVKIFEEKRSKILKSIMKFTFFSLLISPNRLCSTLIIHRSILIISDCSIFNKIWCISIREQSNADPQPNKRLKSLPVPKAPSPLPDFVFTKIKSGVQRSSAQLGAYFSDIKYGGPYGYQMASHWIGESW
uniref:Uncharacterized protein n=1 Tax=Romanomermis culicivorax TaxID=13658 RepID=A0A915J3W1_ROMCU